MAASGPGPSQFGVPVQRETERKLGGNAGPGPTEKIAPRRIIRTLADVADRHVDRQSLRRAPDGTERSVHDRPAGPPVVSPMPASMPKRLHRPSPIEAAL